MTDYDIGKAFEEIENELISSMIRNFKHHKAEETKEGINWEQWQVKQLAALEEYKQRNKKLFPHRFSEINRNIKPLLRRAYREGGMEQETEILKAIKNGFKPPSKSKGTEITGEFFKLNDNKLNSLIKATTNDMWKAETAVLRMANDQYRKIIFNAQVYANSVAGTYKQAVDMAAKDFLSAGINCIEYKNGRRVNIKSYAEMALRTANKRAYLQGEGVKRQEWGINTVILNKRGNPCPLCLPFVGKIFIDDVWSGGTEEESKETGYPLLSEAISAGLYHPNCRDSHTTYFEGISTPPTDSKYTADEIDNVAENYKFEQKKSYAENQAEKFNRLEKFSLDETNKQKYSNKNAEWKEKAEEFEKGISNEAESSKPKIIRAC